MFILGFVVGFVVAGVIGFFCFKQIHDQLTSELKLVQSDYLKLKDGANKVTKAL